MCARVVFLLRVWWARVKPNSNPQPDVSGGSDVLARSSCFLVLALGIASVHAFWCTLINCFACSVHRLSICLRSLVIPVALRPFACYSIHRLSIYLAPYSIYHFPFVLFRFPFTRPPPCTSSLPRRLGSNQSFGSSWLLGPATPQISPVDCFGPCNSPNFP